MCRFRDRNSRIGKRVDVWSQMVTLTEIAALVAAVEIITTVFKQRAPGMSLNRIPLFVWAMVITSFMVIFAMPSVMLSSTMLSMDRLIERRHAFFQPRRRQRPAFVAASFLVFRTPGSLYYFHSGDRFCLLDYHDFFAPPDVRLHGARSGDDCDGVYRLRRVGSSYVRHADSAIRAKYVHRREYADCRSGGHTDFLLAGDFAFGKIEFKNAARFRLRIFRNLSFWAV